MFWLFWQMVEVVFGFLCYVLPWFFVGILVISVAREFRAEFRPKGDFSRTNA